MDSGGAAVPELGVILLTLGPALLCHICDTHIIVTLCIALVGLVCLVRPSKGCWLDGDLCILTEHNCGLVPSLLPPLAFNHL